MRFCPHAGRAHPFLPTSRDFHFVPTFDEKDATPMIIEMSNRSLVRVIPTFAGTSFDGSPCEIFWPFHRARAPLCNYCGSRFTYFRMRSRSKRGFRGARTEAFDLFERELSSSFRFNQQTSLLPLGLKIPC